MGKRMRGLAVMVAAMALAGCHRPAPTHRAPTGARTPPASASASAGACAAGYCAPADWDTERAATPLPQIPPFSEPLNVVISARSTVPLTAIQQALGDWKTVTATASASVAGIHVKCISAERANVTGSGYVTMSQAWRLGGCLHGNELSVTGDEDHVRLWNQPAPGSRDGAWFIAASYETMCVVKGGRLTTAREHEVWTALHPGAAYHCVDGGAGTYHAAHPSGYDDAARDFAAAVAAAGKAKGWTVTQRVDTVARGGHAGEGGVPFSDAVYVLTVTA